jgi:hypothetical protein
LDMNVIVSEKTSTDQLLNAHEKSLLPMGLIGLCGQYDMEKRRAFLNSSLITHLNQKSQYCVTASNSRNFADFFTNTPITDKTTGHENSMDDMDAHKLKESAFQKSDLSGVSLDMEFKSKVGRSELYGDVNDKAEQCRMKQRRILYGDVNDKAEKPILDEHKSIPEPLQSTTSSETANEYRASRHVGVSAYQDNDKSGDEENDDDDDTESIEYDCAASDKNTSEPSRANPNGFFSRANPNGFFSNDERRSIICWITCAAYTSEPSSTNPPGFFSHLQPPDDFKKWKCQKELLPLSMQPEWMDTWCWVVPANFRKYVEDPAMLPPSDFDPKCLVLHNEGSYANQRKLIFRQKVEMEVREDWLEESTYALMHGTQRWEARERSLELAGDQRLYNKWLASQQERVCNATQDWVKTKQLYKSLCHHYYLTCALTPHETMIEELLLQEEPDVPAM